MSKPLAKKTTNCLIFNLQTFFQTLLIINRHKSCCYNRARKQKQSPTKTMTTLNEEKILASIESMQTDLAQTRADMVKIEQKINDIATSQAVLVNDGKWIKILYGVFSSIIIVLLGTLINLKQ